MHDALHQDIGQGESTWTTVTVATLRSDGHGSASRWSGCCWVSVRVENAVPPLALAIPDTAQCSPAAEALSTAWFSRVVAGKSVVRGSRDGGLIKNGPDVSKGKHE